MSQNGGQGARTSPESGDSQKSKVSVIEKSVTHLLIATKGLLETLTKWAKQQSSESEVSDVYVRLGYEFNIACRAFKSVGVETSDLGPVPDMLRGILEETLSGEPSQQHLDRYLPQIRDIIVNLLQGLKKKQQRLRASVQKQERDGATPAVGSSGSRSDRQHSIASTLSEEASGRQFGKDDGVRRQGSGDSLSRDVSRGASRSTSTIVQDAVPHRTSSGRNTNQPPTINEETSQSQDADPSSSRQQYAQDVPKSRPAPYPQADPPSGPRNQDGLSSDNNLEPDRYQGKPGDALARLQRGGELERRASRRFSNYHIQKHLGSSTSGIPMIPPPQHSPVPNRGRDLRESMNAVRTRGFQLDRRGTSKPKYTTDASPGRQPIRHDQIPEETSMSSSNAPSFEMPAEKSPERSPLARTPADKLGSSYFDQQETTGSKLEDRAATIRAEESSDRSASPFQASLESQAERAQSNQTVVRQPTRQYTSPTPEQGSERSSDRSSQSKELTIFLQYKTRIKKFVLPGGYEELSIARLQLAFIEKFAWNTHSNGIDLPEIYIQDPVSGVRHELEDLGDVKSRSVLVLNVDAVDEVKKHMDDSMGGLQTIMQEIRTAVIDQTGVLQRVAQGQEESSRDLTRLASSPPKVPSLPPSAQPKGLSGKAGPSAQLMEVQTLRRDIAVMRQNYTLWVSDVKKSISDVRLKADTVKDLASKPQFKATKDAAASTDRAHILSSRKTMESTSENIMTRIEDLLDTVEDLRKDVVTRGVRPRARQLETVSKELASVTRELKKLQEFAKKEKPTLQKIWRQELQTVYDEQNELSYQEDLVKDLEGDLESANDTFKLVEEATKQQNLVAISDGKAPPPVPGSTPGSKIPSRTLNVSPAPDPRLAKDSVLGEVKALQPNHENRLEAIARAERNRRREMEERQGGEFARELDSFVGEGRLKKSGGVEEAERIRKVKDERARQVVWERMNGVISEEPATTTEGEQQIGIDGVVEDSTSPSDGVDAAMQDLSSLAGSGLPPDTTGSEQRHSAALAEAAKVPQPLDVSDSGKENGGRPNEVHRSGAASPEPQFVEASEEQHGGS